LAPLVAVAVAVLLLVVLSIGVDSFLILADVIDALVSGGVDGLRIPSAVIERMSCLGLLAAVLYGDEGCSRDNRSGVCRPGDRRSGDRR